MNRQRPVVIDHVYLKNKMKKLLRVEGGHTPKTLVWLAHKKELKNGVKKACNSLFFGDLIRSLRKKKSSYSVYFEEDIVGKEKREVVIPEKVRCVIKQLESPHIPYYNEVVGSRLANLLGIPVVYNLAYQKQYEPDLDDQVYDYLISVDYLPDGYKEKSLSSLHINFGSDSMLGGVDSLEQVITEVSRGLGRLISAGTIKNDPECIEQFKTEIVREYLFRNLLCEDGDYCSRNCNMMIAPDGTFSKAPCYDMELLFRGRRSRDFYNSVAQKDLMFLQRTMPDVLKDFISSCNKYSDAIDSVMDNSIKTSDRGQNSKTIVKSNIERLNVIYDQIKKIPEMGD